MKKRLLLLLSMVVLSLGISYAQKSISGTVLNDQKEPLIGASVVVKGTTAGAITDIDGKYSLSVPSDATTLVISFTGFTTQEIPIGASSVIDITLEEGAALQEVVVTAFGIKKDK